MKLKIISDGTAKGTYVCTEDGEKIEGVFSVEWSASVSDAIGITKIMLRALPVEIEATTLDNAIIETKKWIEDD